MNKGFFPAYILNKLKILEKKESGHSDDLSIILSHAKIVKQKPFIRKLYIDFYKDFQKVIGDASGKTIIELGSGGELIKEVIPSVITSDIIRVPGLDMHFDVTNKMPFSDNSIDYFLMLDVLHHIGRPGKFFYEASRCLKENGKILMIEPSNTLWGRFIYKNFHYEDFNLEAGWEHENSERLSGSNQALPWIIFYRDRKKFERLFPSLKIVKLEPTTPFRYIISGGLSFNAFLPSFSYKAVKCVESFLRPFNKYIGMFLFIELQKKN